MSHLHVPVVPLQQLPASVKVINAGQLLQNTTKLQTDGISVAYDNQTHCSYIGKFNDLRGV